ncbi:hypothetical protein CDCA_CDCA09G2834 [Cyanidium caldarium]|uniref:sterol 22-desaturase n=1 Tax=Cyanidium caldarium TaxID=2771 RepID=A0AAV9IXH5_CYACA|nr:hypothetical protein CDCA_CDCA09G2834 [Cyanidium caldarium]
MEALMDAGARAAQTAATWWARWDLGARLRAGSAATDAWLGISAWSVPARCAAYATLLLLLLAIVEQVRLRYKAGFGKIAGPRFLPPFIGCVASMVWQPYWFWEQQRRLCPSGLSWTSIAGFFTVFITNTDVSRFVLNNNGPSDFEMILHPNGWKILGKNNIAFKSGVEHKALRQSFLRLFSRKALGVYLSIQERLIRQHIAAWMQETQSAEDGAARAPLEVRTRVRDLNLMTSQTVFVGPYLQDRERFCRDYLYITQGFLSFPIALPGTGLWRAIQARRRIMRALTECVRRSKKRMQSGDAVEPECLLDFWTLTVLEEVAEAQHQGVPPPKYSADHEMADALLDFLFAAQDASTASLTWTTVLVAERKDVLHKVREEQARLRPNDEPLTYELLEQMTYARAVIMEVLRFRPPPTLVPQVAMRNIPLTDTYTVPRGTLVIPSLWAACMEGFPEPGKFDPERMMPERQEDLKYRKHFMTFGCGPHACVGRHYAINHLMCYLAILATTLNWQRVRTPQSDEIIYLPTIYPADSLIVPEWRRPPPTTEEAVRRESVANGVHVAA